MENLRSLMRNKNKKILHKTLNLVDLCVEAKLGNGIVCRKYDYIFLFLKIHGSLRATQLMRDGVLKKVSLALVVA